MEMQLIMLSYLDRIYHRVGRPNARDYCGVFSDPPGFEVRFVDDSVGKIIKTFMPFSFIHMQLKKAQQFMNDILLHKFCNSIT